MIESLRFEGPEPGPSILILGGVHGEETPGIDSVEALASELKSGRLKLARGAAVLVPRVNALAAEKRVHHVEENLNRIVRADAGKSHEARLARALLPLIEAADAVLDLHGTPAPSVPFAFLDHDEARNRAWARALGVPFVLTGWPDLYKEDGAVTTTEAAHALGKAAMTVEVGMNGDPECGKIGLEIARRSLAHLGLVAPVPFAEPPRVLRFTRLERRTRGGKFARPWANFDRAAKGELLARCDGGVELRCDVDGYVVMPFDEAKHGDEWLYLAVEE